MDAADPVAGAARCHRLGFRRREDAAVHLVFARLQSPFLPLREIGRPRRYIEKTGAAKARLGPQLAIEVAPDLQALHRQRKFAQVAMLLAAPAPVAAALLAGHVTLFDERDRVALL